MEPRVEAHQRCEFGAAVRPDPAVAAQPHTLVAREVAEVFGRRWPESTVGDVGSASPSSGFAIEDVVELARLRRGIEPLRLVVLAQRRSGIALQDIDDFSATGSEPMPVLV